MEIEPESSNSNIEKKDERETATTPEKEGGYTLKRGHEARKKAEEEGTELTWTKKKRRRCGKKKNGNDNVAQGNANDKEDEEADIEEQNDGIESEILNNNNVDNKSGDSNVQQLRKENDKARPINPNRTRSSYPKKKIVLLICYCGENYAGLQRNNNVWTIEHALEKALVQKGVISEDNAGSFTKIGWSSAARTDKGVSALGNVISFKAILIPNLIQEVNSVLPDDIRLLEYKPAPKSFNTKKQCYSRQYHYICPTILFAPSKRHPSYDANIRFVFDEGLKDKINMALECYMGTNKYHNFTERINFTDMQAQRMMIGLQCSGPFMQDNIEFVQITVHGQSFVLHQIRNMIALVINIIRDGMSKNVINACFQKPKKKWHLAPAEGLFLGKTFFDGYNKGVPAEKKLTWQDSETKMETFKNDFMLPHIAKKTKEGIFNTWLENLDRNPLNYDYLMCTTDYEIQIKYPDLTATISQLSRLAEVKPEGQESKQEGEPKDETKPEKEDDEKSE